MESTLSEIKSILPRQLMSCFVRNNTLFQMGDVYIYIIYIYSGTPL